MSERKDALLATKKQLQFQLNRFESSVNEEPADVAAIHARLANSDKVLSQFIRISQELMKIDPSLADEEELTLFEKKFYKTVSKANTITGAHNFETSTKDTQSPTNINLKTPELQKFSGENYEDWPAFHQMFNSLVHNNTSVPKIMKFHYLKGAVIGKASELIKNIEFSELNYSVALQALIDRYENKKKFVQRHMQILSKLGNISYAEKGTKLTAKHLETMYNQATQTLQALEASDIDTSSWDPFVTHAIISKFDEGTLAEWENTAPPKDVPTRKQVFDFLTKRIRIMESLEAKSSKPQNFLTNQTYSRSYEPTQDVPQNFRFCFYCNSVNHQIAECVNFKKLTMPDRALIVTSNNLCRQCLKNHQGHCRNSPCSVCSGNHHHLLHQNKIDLPQIEPKESSQI